MNNKKIIFVFAHLDDELYSMGTIKKLIELGNDVTIHTVCGNGQDIYNGRIQMLEKNAGLIGYYHSSFKYFDLTLSDLSHEVLSEIKDSLKYLISQYDIVFTNNSGDLHKDHQVVSDMVRTICRPNSSNAQALFECYVPGATENGSGTDEFKTIVDISKQHDIKIQAMRTYDKVLKDNYSIKNTDLSSRYFGSLYGYYHAEIFKCIYDRSL